MVAAPVKNRLSQEENNFYRFYQALQNTTELPPIDAFKPYGDLEDDAAAMHQARANGGEPGLKRHVADLKKITNEKYKRIVRILSTGGEAPEQPPEEESAPQRKFIYASEVEERPIEWIWQDRLARGCFTLAVGDGGVGKGLTINQIIAAITQGLALPGGQVIGPAGVILMSPEDPASRIIVPRLKAAGADLSKVLLLTEIEEVDASGQSYTRPVSFPDDAHILEEAIEDAEAVLVVIDPVLSMLSGRVDAYKNHAVRLALARVMSIADKRGVAVLGVMHTTKAQHPNVLFRSSSSSAFIEMARTALFYVADPDGEPGQSGVIVNYKNNLVKHADSIRYRILRTEKNIGYAEWVDEPTTYTRDELLNQNAPSNSRKSEEASDGENMLLKRQKTAALFLSDECELNPDAKTLTQDLNARYMSWCKQVLENPNTSALREALNNSGLHSERSTGGKYVYKGIALKPIVSPPSDKSEGSEGSSTSPELKSEGSEGSERGYNSGSPSLPPSLSNPVRGTQSDGSEGMSDGDSHLPPRSLPSLPSLPSLNHSEKGMSDSQESQNGYDPSQHSLEGSDV